MDPITDLRRHIAAHQNSKRAFVTLSYAQSLDGSIALNSGETFAISGAESLQLTHRLRAEHDAILVGIGTVLADDPSLTVRHADGENPRPIVLDSSLTIPNSSNLLKHPHKLIIITTEDAPERRMRALANQGVIVIPFPADINGINLEELVISLPQLGIHSVMVEGGSQVITSFLRQNLADWAMITIAPYFTGGLKAIAKPLISATTSSINISTFPKLNEWQSSTFGDDLVVWGTLK